jgi:hypothetical protein
MVFQGTFLVGCLELGIGRRWIDTQSIVVFCVFDHLAVAGEGGLDGFERREGGQGGREPIRKKNKRTLLSFY